MVLPAFPFPKLLRTLLRTVADPVAYESQKSKTLNEFSQIRHALDEIEAKQLVLDDLTMKFDDKNREISIVEKKLATINRLFDKKAALLNDREQTVQLKLAELLNGFVAHNMLKDFNVSASLASNDNDPTPFLEAAKAFKEKADLILESGNIGKAKIELGTRRGREIDLLQTTIEGLTNSREEHVEELYTAEGEWMVCLQTLEDIKQQWIAAEAQSSYDKSLAAGRAIERHKLGPLAQDGARIRHRRLEWVAFNGKVDILLDAGNSSAHRGSVLSDAELYQPSCEYGSRNDKETFRKLYGVYPELVWKYKDCENLIKVLDWRANVYDFCHSNYHRFGPFNKTEFMKRLAPMLEQVEKVNGAPVSTIRNVFTNMKSRFEKLEREHSEMLVKHQQYIKTR
jgi:hypothetical protein